MRVHKAIFVRAEVYSTFSKTLNTAVQLVHKRLPNNTIRKIMPPFFDLSLFLDNCSCSSASLGRRNNRDKGSTAITEVNEFNFHNPSTSLRLMASLLTSQIPAKRLPTLAAQTKAMFPKVVNMAYDEPSAPS